MSLFRRLFKPKTEAPGRATYRELTEAVGLLLLAAHEKRDDSLRHSPRLGELLGLLWQDNPQAIQAVHDVFSSVERIDRGFVESLGRRLHAAQPDPPPTSEGRYDAVVQALYVDINAIPFPVTESVVSATETKHFVNVLTLARILLPPELHVPICAFLVTDNRVRRDGPDSGDTLPYQELIRDNIFRFLAVISPEAMPHFWTILRDPTVSEEFWPALRRIRDRKAVPYLLELLPAAQDKHGSSPMTLRGQQEVIQVLREIGDMQAVPVLLAMEKQPLPPPVDRQGIQSEWDRALSATWRERNDLARAAGQTARHILRNSGEAGAQLLRPSEVRTQHGETLLRPAPADAGATPPDELLRPLDAPERTNELP